MTFLTPLIAAVAAGIAVPSLVILYFLKLRRRSVEVSTTLLWKKAIQDLQANAPFQRLRRNILLLLQLLVLGAALLAVAQPQLTGQTSTNSRQIIMIDRSASMSALDGGGAVDSGAVGSGGSDGVTRLESAKREARELVDALPEAGVFGTGTSGEAMVIAFDVTAEVRQQFTNDKAALRAAIDAIKPTDAPTLMGEAMRLAKAHAPRRKYVDDRTSQGGDVQVYDLEGLQIGAPVTIHIWSDGRVADLNESRPGLDDEVVFHRVGQPESANAAIVSLRYERSYEDPSKLSVFASVQSTFAEARSVDVELSIDGQVAGIRSLQLPAASVRLMPGQSSVSGGSSGSAAGDAAVTVRRVDPAASGVVFQLERTEGAVAQVRLRTPNLDTRPAGDALESDDRAWIVIPPARKLSVAAVTEGNLFLAAALEGLPLAKLDTLTPTEYQKRVADGRALEYDVVILDQWLPESKSSPAAAASPAGQTPAAVPTPLSPGRYLIFGKVPSGAGMIDRGVGVGGAGGVGGGGAEGLFIDWMRDHPVLRNLTLDAVIIAEMRSVEVERGSGAIALAQTNRGAGIVEATGPSGVWRAVVVPFEIERSNWPFDVSFVVFMASAVDYLGGSSGSSPVSESVGRLPQGMVQPGSVLSDRLPIGASGARVRLPIRASEGGSRVEESLSVAPDGRIVFGPVRTVGVYDVSWAGPAAPADRMLNDRPTRSFAANLMDSAESDVGSSDELALATKVVTASSAAGKADRRLWPWLLLAALVIVMLEWFVYNRKVHV